MLMTKKKQAAVGASHAAPGPYLGFGLQPVRLMRNLLDAPAGAIAFIEHDDDVSVHRADGSVLLEQTKSALASEPAADYAVDLWKALANWAKHMASDQAPTGAVTFRYYVTPVKTGRLVQRMHHAWDQPSVEAVLEAIDALEVDLSDGPKWHAHVRTFRAAPKATRALIVRHFEYLTEADPAVSILGSLSNYMDAFTADHMAKVLLGHVKATTDALLRQRQRGQIAVDALRQYTQQALSRVRAPALVTTGAPSQAAIATTLDESPRFLQQLDLIDASSRQRIDSVTHFLQAEADLTAWAAAGRLLDGDTETWSRTLLALHESTELTVRIENSGVPEKHRGMLVYLKCCKGSADFCNQRADDYFLHGSLHRLADGLAIGWHPDYQTLL
jgi:hypothetical protein